MWLYIDKLIKCSHVCRKQILFSSRSNSSGFTNSVVLIAMLQNVTTVNNENGTRVCVCIHMCIYTTHTNTYS